MPEEESHELWAAFLSGEEAAFSRLYRAFYPQLYRYGLHLTPHEETVKDVIQDTFYYLFIKRATLTTEVGSVRAYLLTTFRRNLIRKRQQQRQEQGRHVDRTDGQELTFTVGAEDLLIREQSGQHNKKLLAELLNELPARQREILYLKYYHGQSLNEIADTLAITYQTVANQLYRALKKLRGSDRLGGFVKTALVLLYNQLN